MRIHCGAFLPLLSEVSGEEDGLCLVPRKAAANLFSGASSAIKANCLFLPMHMLQENKKGVFLKSRHFSSDFSSQHPSLSLQCVSSGGESSVTSTSG